jgi:hypothetical protein
MTILMSLMAPIMSGFLTTIFITALLVTRPGTKVTGVYRDHTITRNLTVGRSQLDPQARQMILANAILIAKPGTIP